MTEYKAVKKVVFRKKEVDLCVFSTSILMLYYGYSEGYIYLKQSKKK